MAQIAPAPMAAPTSAAGTDHVVVRGETLYGIATQQGVSAADLAKWNDIADPGMIQVGQKLRLSAP
jgi:LysM repeat protein